MMDEKILIQHGGYYEFVNCILNPIGYDDNRIAECFYKVYRP